MTHCGTTCDLSRFVKRDAAGFARWCSAWKRTTRSMRVRAVELEISFRCMLQMLTSGAARGAKTADAGEPHMQIQVKPATGSRTTMLSSAGPVRRSGSRWTVFLPT